MSSFYRSQDQLHSNISKNTIPTQILHTQIVPYKESYTLQNGVNLYTPIPFPPEIQIHYPNFPHIHTGITSKPGLTPFSYKTLEIAILGSSISTPP